MRKNLLLALSLVVSAMAGAQNWNTAVLGFSSYDVDEFEKAKTNFENAIKHEKEFSKGENAKLHYYYGKSLLKTEGNSLEGKVEAYNAFETAAKYDEGEYAGTLKVEIEELKSAIKTNYDNLESHKAEGEEQIKLYLRACEIIGYVGNQEDYKLMLENLNK